MTIADLLRRLAEHDDLPTDWRVQIQRAVTTEPAPGDRQRETGEPVVPREVDRVAVLEMRWPTGDWRRIGEITTDRPSLRLRESPDDWVNGVTLVRDLPAFVVIPILSVLRDGVDVTLSPDPADLF